MKTVKVTHSIFTIAFTSSAIAAGAGMDRDQVDELVNRKMAEGDYDSVEVIPLKSNFSDSLQLESVVNQYVFRKNVDEPAVSEPKSKK